MWEVANYNIYKVQTKDLYTVASNCYRAGAENVCKGSVYNSTLQQFDDW